MTIATTVAAVRDRSVRVVDVVAAAIARAERSQADLNAFTHIDAERALDRASWIDGEIAAGRRNGALLGIPIALKDLIDQSGVPNTLGAGFNPVVPERDAPVVRRLEDAGAVIIGRTGLHEFAYGFTSENEHFGPVRNPWDLRLSPGGSSGGSGAAVGAGIVPMAVGTDTGGSVRVPAALCGVYGLKVTHGAVPLTGVYPLAPSLDTVGPLARSAADLATAFAVMANAAPPADPWPIDRIRIGVVHQWLAGPTDAAVTAALEGFLAAVGTAGAAVLSFDLPDLTFPTQLLAAASPEIAAVHRPRWEQHPEGYGREIAARLEAAFATPPGAETEVAGWTDRANHRLSDLFTEVDVLATPTVGATRKAIGVDTIDVAGQAHRHRDVLAPWTAPINRLGLPAIAAPLPAIGTPPPSLQLVASKDAEPALLGITRGLESAGLVGVSRPPLWFD